MPSNPSGSASQRGPHPLPDYTVRVSQRARRVRLIATPKEGLVVVVPRGFRGDVSAIVSDSLPWIERALGRVAERRALYLAGPDALLPHVVEFAATGESWRVEYRGTDVARVTVREGVSEIVVSGDIEDGDACLAALGRWLDRAARPRLVALLDEEARSAGITYAKHRVARQRTRWGSCSARGTISLNRNLVFVPEHLARSVVRHELVHTLVLDHSERFWRTLERYDPDASAHRAELKRGSVFVPPWADA